MFCQDLQIFKNELLFCTYKTYKYLKDGLLFCNITISANYAPALSFIFRLLQSLVPIPFNIEMEKNYMIQCFLFMNSFHLNYTVLLAQFRQRP
jgi:hypothetical protein